MSPTGIEWQPNGAELCPRFGGQFGETANWRRLERFSLPGISEVRIQEYRERAYWKRRLRAIAPSRAPSATSADVPRSGAAI
jgi:hypothetical protein